jgi:hypothetical protein
MFETFNGRHKYTEAVYNADAIHLLGFVDFHSPLPEEDPAKSNE